MRTLIQYLILLFVIGDLSASTPAKTYALSDYAPKTVIEGDVFMGWAYPTKVITCKDATVYGDPYGLAEPIEHLQPGAVLALHEVYGEWVMIEPAKWIRTQALCPWGFTQ